jgi:3-oxoacyl-(acyl-carrier-protein) synthase
MMGRRVVITGIGMVTPIGIGRETYWQAALAGRSGTGPPTRLGRDDLPVRVVGEIKDFVPTDHMPKKLVVRTDLNAQYLFAAVSEALADARLDMAQEDKSRAGFVLAANYGGVNYCVDNLVRLHQKGPSFVSAYLAIAWIPSAPAGQLSIFYGISGYTKTVVNDMAGGTDAIGEAFRAIRSGEADLLITGGADAPISEASMAWLTTFRDACRDAPDPASAFRPFSVDRLGHVAGEGGAAVIVEELSRAQARGAPIYAEIVGHGQTSDGVDLHHGAADGVQYARAMTRALKMGDLTPDDVDYVNADGRATELGDQAEAAALRRVFGTRLSSVAVSAPKSMIGHSYAGAGAIDVASTALSLRDGVVPPTINVGTQDPACDLPLVTDRPREGALSVAVIAARGTSGVNSALVLKKLA